MDIKEEDIKFEIISEGEVPQTVIDEIKEGLAEEEQENVDTSDLTELTVQVKGLEDPLKIVGFKSMLHNEANGDMTIRMIIAQLLENQNERETNQGKEN